MDAMKASDLLAIIEAFVAAHGDDTQIVSIMWTQRAYGSEFDVKIETLESWPPRRPAPITTEIREGGAGRVTP